MQSDRQGLWPAVQPPVWPDYHHRLRPSAGRVPPGPVWAAVRVTGATATTVAVACLAVAVPCLVFAAVGFWFGDVSTADAARTAAVCGTAAAGAAVPAVVCHRRLAARRRRHRPWAQWN